jgi:chromosome segregation ATPase
MANIKFFRKNTAPSNPIDGYVWFNSADRTISLYKDGNWEKYAGILSASFTGNVLTITPATGSAITVDLSDMASASTLNTLSNNFNTLQTSFNTLSGEFTTAKSDISTLKGEMTDVKTEVAKLEGITDKVTTYVVSKIGEVETAYKAKDTELANRITPLETTTNTHTTEISELKGLVGTTAVATQISNAINALDNGTNGVSGTGEKVTVTVKQVDGKVTSVTVSDSDIASAQALSDLTTTVANNKTAVEEALGGTYSKNNTVAAAIQAAKNAADAAQADIDAWNAVTEDTDGVIETIKELNTYITEHTDAFTGLSNNVSTNTTDIATNTADIADLKTAVETINTTIEENEETIAAALTDLDVRVNNLASGTVTSVTGEGYISATTTDGDVVVTATTGAVANGTNALAIASDVKSYVDNIMS